MQTFKFVVSVECESLEQAEEVLAERLYHDEDYGFYYRLPGWERA